MLSPDTGLWVVFLARSFDLSLALGMASALFFCLCLLGLDHHHRAGPPFIGSGKEGIQEIPPHTTHTQHTPEGFFYSGGVFFSRDTTFLSHLPTLRDREACADMIDRYFTYPTLHYLQRRDAEMVKNEHAVSDAISWSTCFFWCFACRYICHQISRAIPCMEAAEQV